MKTLFIKPAPGCAVRDPDTLEFLQPDGEEKPFTSYWCRRLDDGDVVEFDPNAATAPAKPPKNAVVTAADVEKDA